MQFLKRGPAGAAHSARACAGGVRGNLRLCTPATAADEAAPEEKEAKKEIKRLAC
jgi:hypothetical protein